MKLGIGTAQFGMDYGISNTEGRSSESEVKKILKTASDSGVLYLDTAPQYGCSEQIIGQCLPYKNNFKIVTKTPKLSSCDIGRQADLIERTLSQSLTNLRQNAIYCLLLHEPNIILQRNSLVVEKMLELREKRLTQKIGISIYTKEQIDNALIHPFDIIQAPINIFDQRLIISGHLKFMKDAGIEIHARSAFLQGLLLMSPGEIPNYFLPYKSKIVNFQTMAEKHSITPLQLALSFVFSLKEISTVIIGVNSNLQLLEILDKIKEPIDEIDFSKFAINDEKLVNPSKWKI